MFCLNATGIFTTAFTLPVSNPNTASAYNIINEMPHVNDICLPLSANRQNLGKEDLNEYQCFCIEADIESKKIVENARILIEWMKKINHPSIKILSKVSTDISKYLESEFKHQDQIIKFLKKETKEPVTMSGHPITIFTIHNLLLPFDQFYDRYSVFLTRHLAGKFRSDLERLKILNIPRVFKTGSDFLNCNSRHLYRDGDFKTISDVIKAVNQRVLALTKSVINNAS